MNDPRFESPACEEELVAAFYSLYKLLNKSRLGQYSTIVNIPTKELAKTMSRLQNAIVFATPNAPDHQPYPFFENDGDQEDFDEGYE